jgi:ParB/RepB/Spo0J family partition protein
MAKRPNRALNQIIEGVSEEKVLEAQRVYEKNKQAMLNKTPFIELPLGTRMVSYELVTVAPDQIQAQTKVLDTNARYQGFLCAESLGDITETMRAKGQQFPAIGQRTEQGIVVFDGSRRRASCLLTQQPFLIYVTDEAISSDEALFQSNTGNAHKPLSLYEQGLQWKAWIDAGLYKDAKALAQSLKKSDSLVYDAVNAVSIPLALLTTFPMPSDIGRPLYNQVRKFMKQYDLTLMIEAGQAVQLAQTNDGMKITNQKHLESIKFELNKLGQVTSKKAPQQVYYGSHKEKATVRKTKQGAQITLDKLSPLQLERLDDLIMDFLKQAELTV